MLMPIFFLEFVSCHWYAVIYFFFYIPLQFWPMLFVLINTWVVCIFFESILNSLPAVWFMSYFIRQCLHVLRFVRCQDYSYIHFRFITSLLFFFFLSIYRKVHHNVNEKAVNLFSQTHANNRCLFIESRRHIDWMIDCVGRYNGWCSHKK